MRLLFIAALAVSFCLLYSDVGADTIVANATADTTIYQDNTGNSNGSGDFIFAGNNGGNSPRRSLIEFDLSAIPTGATITNVTFTAFMSQGTPANLNVSLHRVTADWGESTSDAPGGEGGGTAAVAGDATWTDNFFGSSNWTNNGGDFVASASATTVVGDVGSYSWSSAGLVSDVEDWLDGTNANFGWILIGDESGATTAKRFNSRTNSTSPLSLTVEFTSVPEPASGLLLATFMFGYGATRRKR